MKKEHIKTLEHIIVNGENNNNDDKLVCSGRSCDECPFGVGSKYIYCGVANIDWYDLIRISKKFLDK